MSLKTFTGAVLVLWKDQKLDFKHEKRVVDTFINKLSLAKVKGWS